MSKPKPVTPKQIADAVGELKNGNDATVNVAKWDRYIAAKEAGDGGSFHDALTRHEGPHWAAFAREVFATMYQSGASKELPSEAKSSAAEWVEKMHETASTLPEWKTLMARAQRDAWACGVAAGEALKVVADQVTPPTEDVQGIEDELDFVKSLLDGANKTSPQHLRRMAGLQKQLQTAKQAVSQAAKGLAMRAASVRSAMRGGAQKANEAIAEMDSAMDGLCAGDGTGIASRANVPPAALRKQLASNDKLRRIAALAGRMKHAAIRKQRTKSRIGQEEICDVTMGANLSRLLPVELGALADDTTEALLYRRLLEGAAMQYDLRGKEQKSEGPIILCVDESGSMGGAPDEWAKAVLFGLMEVAARQNRPVHLIHFDSRVSRVDSFPDARNMTLKAIVDCVCYFTGGGTSIGAALEGAADIMRDNDGPWKRADVILITDGEDYAAEYQAAQIRRIKDRGGHLYLVAIGVEPGGVLGEAADEKVHLCSEDIESGDTTKVSAVFGM